MYRDAEQEIAELMRLLGLSRQDVLALLKELEATESRYGDFGRALLLQQADRETARLDRLWMGLSAAFGLAVSTSVERGWVLGVEAAQEIAAHMGESLAAPMAPMASTASTIARNAIPFADKATMEIESRIRGELVRGILGREDMQTLTKRLVGAGLGTEGTPWKSAASRAEAVINSETSRAYHAALQDSFNQASWAVGYQWVVYPEGPWPCPACAPRNGIVYAKGMVPAIPAHPNCYSSDTEVLTKEGWKHFRDLGGEEQILSLNPETHEPEWSGIRSVVNYQYDGEMLRFYSKILDLCVTPDHRMYVANRPNIKDRSFRKWQIRTAKEVADIGEWYVKRNASWFAPRVDSVDLGEFSMPSDLYAQFMGYWLSEGCVSSWGKTGQKLQVCVAQSQQHKKNKMADDISALEPRVGKTCIYIFNQPLAKYLQKFGKSHDKYLPDELLSLDAGRLRLFLEAFMLGDGTTRELKEYKGGHFKPERGLFTSSPKMMVGLVEAVLKCGDSVSVSYRPRQEEHQYSNGIYPSSESWRISWNRRGSASVKRDKIERIDYHGIVGDVELEKNHILLVRRNNKVAWSGNCRCSLLVVTEKYGAYDVGKAHEH
jgi:hypothetical protein